MKIYSEIPSHLPRTGLTIGTFDGLHLGHAALIAALKKRSPFVSVVTFTNHPQEVFSSPPPLIYSLEQKLELLQQMGVDAVIAFPFTIEFAMVPFDQFLDRFSLSHLLLGKGAAFGKNREGNEQNVLAYAAQKGIEVEYIPKMVLDGEPITSRRIRTCLAAAQFETASRLLGRPYKGL